MCLAPPLIDLISMENSTISRQNENRGTLYMYDTLPSENVFGHAKKVRLIRSSIDRMRHEKGRQGLRILDIGCGSGYAVTRFLGRIGDNVLGIDMYPPNIHYAATHFVKEGLSFICVDAPSFSGIGKLFDVVVMADVLEHLADPSTMLKNAVELLAPSGRLLVTVPNGRGPFEIESAIGRVPFVGPTLLKLTDIFVASLNKSILKGMWSRAISVLPNDLPYNKDSGHLQFFSRSGLIELMNSKGLEVVRFHNLSFLSGPFTNYILSPWRAFCLWNARISEHLPPWLSSAWFLECRKV